MKLKKKYLLHIYRHKKATTSQAIVEFIYFSNVFKKVREAYLKE